MSAIFQTRVPVTEAAEEPVMVKVVLHDLLVVWVEAACISHGHLCGFSLGDFLETKNTGSH